jgi:DNA-directed RNA polymerase subunit beta
MVKLTQPNNRLRKGYGKLEAGIKIPNLIEIQKRSFASFLQADLEPESRDQEVGIEAAFNRVFPIFDYNDTAELRFKEYHLGEPKYDEGECRARGLTYAAPLEVVVELITYEVDSETSAKTFLNLIEQPVFFGEIPLMTAAGTFIINGTERVVVSQLHRSPGAFFELDKSRSTPGAKKLYTARIIPYQGSWLDFEFDTKDLMHVRIDRRRKLPATILLRALGYDEEFLLNYFYERIQMDLTKAGKASLRFDPAIWENKRASRDLIHPGSKKQIVPRNRVIKRGHLKRLGWTFDEKKGWVAEAGALKKLELDGEELGGQRLAADVVDKKTGEVLARRNQTLDAAEFLGKKLEQTALDAILEAGVKSVEVLLVDKLNMQEFMCRTLEKDGMEQASSESDPEKTAQECALQEIYKRMRPGDPPTPEAATALFNRLFFNKERYNLSRVGRHKLNRKFNLDEPENNLILTKRDILEAVKYLIEVRHGRKNLDDIDHLGNRRIRSVGELLENQYRLGLVRMERAIRERMSLQDIDSLNPAELVNPKPVNAAIKEFFGSSQLSQFMDQTNPLSEVTHMRRLSALGPGGLTRERAGFEVRDVHPTHYGRICPIETPEGPNIGLIASLATYARVNKLGFIETPYQRVVEGQPKAGDITYFSALDEAGEVIAQASEPADDKGVFINELIQARHEGEIVLVPREEVTMRDVAPNQLVSVAASLIPFLEHDDANRALMGSNMQRQAVPLLRTESPFVGTGIEAVVAQDSGVTITARRGGTVESVEGCRVVVRAADGEDSALANPVDIYSLVKFTRSNQNTCLTQRPVVRVGDTIEKGEIIADGPSTEMGELALGRNCVVAFMPWHGYNFEDSILVSEEIVEDDLFTSLHVEEFECVARDTKLGPEEITQDIPNVGQESLMDLDDSGIIRVGAKVGPGDILVGKTTPKGETQLSPEEKLLRAIFGDKAGDVRDTSLRVPPGEYGTVIGAKVFSRRGIDKDERAREIEDEEIAALRKDAGDEIRILRLSSHDRARVELTGQKLSADLRDTGRKVILKKGTKLTGEVLADLSGRDLAILQVDDGEMGVAVASIFTALDKRVESIQERVEARIDRLTRGEELSPGVIKMVKVYVAVKRKLMVGDKMAGRHGNKGVVSRILPREDMPYRADGRPVQLVLNPLGVPSRMNVGQILETHLGLAALSSGEVLNEMIETGSSAKDLRKVLNAYYDSDREKEQIAELDDDGVIAVANKERRGLHVATPVFDGANEDEISRLLELGHQPANGRSPLFDGRTGDAFDQDVTVGVMYMLKLHHLVDEKIHARSIGPYSLVTQQPLGGKAQFGGQRLGEMEVWAMEGYGAAFTLQEFLTVKSDDVQGRTRMYEAIVKGEHVLEAGIPESFNVLMKELQALCLDVELLNDRDADDEDAAPLF